MTQTKKLGGVVLLAIAGAIVAMVSLKHVSGIGASKQSRGSTAADVRAVAMTRTGAAGSRGELAAADPVGTLRLEGEVLDGGDHPVAGARVSVDTVPVQVVTTESDGAFAFDGLLARHYQLLAVADSGVAGPVKARLDQKTEPVILKLRAAAAVDVTVVDAGTGAPIQGATIEVRTPIVAVAKTGASGTAAVAPVVPGHWGLVVAAPSYATAYDTVVASASARDRAVVALKRGVHASGRVLNGAGKPVGDALVWLDSVSDYVNAPDPSRDGVHSAADGTFELAGVSRGSYVVRAATAEHAMAASNVLRIDSDIDGIELHISPGLRLTGTVVRKDRSAATEATVRVSSSGGTRLTHVDRGGGFVIDGLAAGAVWVVASDGEASSKPRGVELKAATKPVPLELVLENDEAIAGMVVDQAGAPVEGAQVVGVRTDSLDAAANAATSSYELSDSSGRFTLHGLVAGVYKLSATRDPQHPGNPKSTSAKTGASDVKITLASPGTIKGRVTFKVGGAPALYTVRAGRGGLPAVFTTDAFQIEAPPGPAALWIDGPGFTAASVDGIEVTADAVSDAGTITLERGRTLRGGVINVDGSALRSGEVIAGALLTGTGQRVDAGDAGPNLRSDIKRAPVGPDGSFRLEGVATTSVSVVATAGSGARSAPLLVQEGTDDVSGLALAIKQGAQLSGTVTLRGAPIRAIVNAAAQVSPLTTFTVMSSDGSYRYDELAPGRYTVAAITGNPLAGSPFYPHSVDLAPGGSATLDIAIVPGDATLTVQAPGATTGLIFVTTSPGSATTALALLTELDRQDSGQWAMAPIRDGAATFQYLTRGPARACVVQIPLKAAPSPSALVEYVVRAGASVPAMCAPTELTGAGTVTIGTGSSAAL